MTEENKKFLDAADMMDMLLISRTTLQAWIDNEKMNFPKPFKVGRKLIWKKSEVEAYLESMRRQQLETTKKASDATN